VLQTRRPVIVNQADAQLGTKCSVFAPLLAKGQVIGVLQAHSPGSAGGNASGGFGHDDADLLATVANTAAVAIENARLFAETQRRLMRLQALRTIDLAISSSMDAHISLRVLVDQAATHLGVDAVDVLLLDNDSHRLEMAAGRGFKSPPPRFSLRVDEGNAGRAFMERRLLRVPKLPGQSAHSARAPWIAAEGFVAYFGMPLMAKGLARGVLEVFHRASLTPDAEWMDFLETLAEQAAIAVDNSGLFAELQRSNTDLELAYDTTLEGWSRALDLRDKETEGHTQRVTDVTERLARTMGLNEADLMHIRRGALLHDIGKMGIPDSILLKPGALTEDEWAIMRKHPIYAYELLAPIAYLRTALDIPYCHHEKWDGTGYPRGVKGEQIPLAARVFAVVDVWDALRSDRPYRLAWPEGQVREHIRELTGTHFDPRVVTAFLALPVLS
jgi:putative nucleotidyltransferase with HDIG domain